jgi:hypothetical protein
VAIDGFGLGVDGSLFLREGFEAEGAVSLLGAHIGGQLNCAGGKFRNSEGLALDLERCDVAQSAFLGAGFEAEGKVDMVGAHIGGELSCDGGKFRNPEGVAIEGFGLGVDGSLFLQEGFGAQGEVSLLGAHIGGQLSCNGGKFRNSEGLALNLERCEVTQSASLGAGFEAQGEVSLLGAHIGGELSCHRGTFRNPEGVAIAGAGLHVDGGLFLQNGFEAEGEVILLGAHIGGQFSSLAGGKFINPKGVAIAGSGLHVDGSLFLQKGFEAQGGIELLAARVGGQLNCDGGKFRNPEGVAIDGFGLGVDGSLFLREGFEAEGEVSLPGARVGGQLSCAGGKFRNPEGVALDLERCETSALLLLPGLLDGGLDLTHARVGNFCDAPSTWPSSLWLAGFSYESIDREPIVSAEDRLRWLESSLPRPAGYSPQPYEALAAAYRRAGREDDVRRVGIAKRRRRRKQLRFPARMWDWVLDALVVYGYRTYRAAVWLALLLVVGTMSLTLAEARGMLTPAANLPQQHEFNAFLYAVDWIVPILNLHQREAWIAHGPAQWLTLGLAAAGWVLTTAVVLGLSGVLKRD